MERGGEGMGECLFLVVLVRRVIGVAPRIIFLRWLVSSFPVVYVFVFYVLVVLRGIHVSVRKNMSMVL